MLLVHYRVLLFKCVEFDTEMRIKNINQLARDSCQVCPVTYMKEGLSCMLNNAGASIRVVIYVLNIKVL